MFGISVSEFYKRIQKVIWKTGVLEILMAFYILRGDKEQSDSFEF